MEARCGCSPDGTEKPPPPVPGPVEVVVVTSHGCHLCVVALTDLEELSTEVPLQVRTVDIGSPEGAEILRVHRPPAPPVFLIDGEFFGFGRLQRRKLRKVLERKLSR